jgi:hypothetical protein
MPYGVGGADAKSARFFDDKALHIFAQEEKETKLETKPMG